MKMARSRTRKKSGNKTRPVVVPQAVTTAASDYITQWTKHELHKLQRVETSPICIPTKNGYKIGLYSLKLFPNKTCEVYDHNTAYI